MKSLLEELTALAYRDDDCNCHQCVEARTEDVRNDVFRKIYPELPFMPRNNDMDLAFNDSDHPAHHARGDERYKEVLRWLKDLRVRNTAEIQILQIDGVGEKRITYCLDCGRAIKKLKKRRFHAQLKGDAEEQRYYMCDLCRNNYSECRDCKKMHKSRVLFRVYDTQKDYDAHQNGLGSKYVLVCRSCYEHGYMKCMKCGLPTHKDTFTKVFPANNQPRYLCEHCEKNDRCKCRDCGVNTYRSIAVMGNNGARFCPECWEKRVPIHNHDYKPSKFNFKGGKREGKVSMSALHFGIELEIERLDSAISREAMAELIKERFGTEYGYLVHDGSLDDGVELVSHPVTWDRYVTEKDRWNEVLLYVRKKDWGVLSTCGVHVHMTKAAFKQFQLFKFLKFFHTGSNKKFIDLIAGRKQVKYAVFNATDAAEISKVAKDKKNRPFGGNMHYNAVNLMSPDTLEVRIFRGTVEPLIFHKNVEFCQALFEFSMTHATREMIEKYFRLYVEANKKRFPALVEYLAMPDETRKLFILSQKARR
jgi:hypothetical protein